MSGKTTRRLIPERLSLPAVKNVQNPFVFLQLMVYFNRHIRGAAAPACGCSLTTDRGGTDLKRYFCILLLAALTACAAILPAAAGGEDWQAGYRQLIGTGRYDDYLQNPDEDYGVMLAERDRAWDSFILHDFERDGIPELIIRADYAIEQADVFTWNGEDAAWAGTMGGENFFQGFLWYPEDPQAGLITLSGGPVMAIDSYVLRDGKLERTALGRTEADPEGMETAGVILDAGGEKLRNLLYGTLAGGADAAEWLENWVSLSELINQGEWERLFR